MPRSLPKHLFLILFFVLGLAHSTGLTTGAWAGENRFRAAWPATDFSKRAIPLEQIISGGPPKDGIPAIDHPRFITQGTAAQWLDPREPVISLEINGEARAYPLQILMFHEIVNDQYENRPVSVTFCPLCNAAIVFRGEVGGKATTFGTTGLLRNSDLVMYDRLTESWWQQFTGKGIVGRHMGTRLERLPSAILAFNKFRELFPHGKVLSRQTGYSRQYGRNPYRGYDQIGNNPFLLSDPVDPRLPAMERVLGVVTKGKARVYPFSILSKQPVINDELAGIPLVVLSRPGTLSALDAGVITDSRTTLSATSFSRRLDGRLLTFWLDGKRILDRETHSEWNLMGRSVAGPLHGKQLKSWEESGVHFAFAWLVFRPKSTVYKNAP